MPAVVIKPGKPGKSEGNIKGDKIDFTFTVPKGTTVEIEYEE